MIIMERFLSALLMAATTRQDQSAGWDLAAQHAHILNSLLLLDSVSLTVQNV